MNKQHLIWLVVAGLGIAACDKQEPDPFPDIVNVGYHADQPGWGWLDKPNTWSGFDVDLGTWLGQRFKFTPAPVAIASGNREAVLQAGTVTLVLATYSITDERKKIVGMAGPYMVTSQGVLVRSGERRIRTVNDLPGKSVCVVKNTTSELQIDAIGGVRKVVLNGWAECVDRLANGLVDAVSTDQLVLYGFAKRRGKLTVVEGLTFGHPEEYGIGYPFGDAEKCKALTAAIKDFVANGYWTTFLEQNTDLHGDAQIKHRPDISNLNACPEPAER